MKCPVCSADNLEENTAFCYQCGTAIKFVDKTPKYSPQTQKDSAQISKDLSQNTGKVYFPCIPIDSNNKHFSYFDISESKVQKKALLYGIILGVLVTLLLCFITDKNSMIGSIFKISPTLFIPTAILIITFWGFFILWYRWHKFLACKDMSGRRLLTRACEVLDTIKNPDDVIVQLGDNERKSPLLRVVSAVIEQWIKNRNFNEADIVMNQHLQANLSEVHSGYNLVRTFIWALPVLGLIGTVLGIADAVGGFSNFLGGNIDKVEVIKENLIKVTSGLSFSFIITFLGLLTSLLLMFPTTLLQNREEKLYARIQDDMVEVFLPKMQVCLLSTSSSVPNDVGFEVWRKSIEDVTKKVLGSVDLTVNKLLAKLDDWQQNQKETLLNQVDSAGHALNGVASAVAEAISKETATWNATFSTAVTEATDTIAGTLAPVSANSKDLLAKFGQALDASTKQSARFDELVNRQEKSLQTVADSIASLANTTQEALQCQLVLREAFKELAGKNIEQHLSTLAQGVSIQGQTLIEYTELVKHLTSSTAILVQSNERLNTAVAQLDEAGLARTLMEFRDSLNVLAPVMKSLQRPMVWTLSPADDQS